MNLACPPFPMRQRRDLPATPALPGSIQTLACRWIPLGFFEWCRQTLGDRFTLYPIDMQPVVFLSHPGDVRAVLQAPSSVLHPGAGGSALGPIVGAHSFMLREADEHMQGRRAITPAFSMTALERHTRTLSEIVDAEVASWPLDRPFPVHPRLRSMSLRIVLSTVFRESPAKLQALHDHMLKMLDVTASFALVEPRLRKLPPWRTIWRRFEREREYVDHEIRTLIERGRAIPSGDDVLARLLAAHNPDGSPMTPTQVRDNLVSLLLAGHETTASEISWALQLLAHNPNIQARLAAEISAGGDAYMNATVAEVLRHRPVFLFAIPRIVAEPIEIRGWTYRPPAQLLACVYLLHHDSALYSDPHVFRPERFLSDGPRASEWLPWGGGRKRCPGHRLATFEMRAVLRAALAANTVTPASRFMERARWRSVIVTPSRGGRVLLRRRHASASTGA